jgi:GPH family glycoside/pentoside/hexuronide:cation symporter
MLYYTKALGLSPLLAGWAMAASSIWDAVTDPVMGHISDNTRSRLGKRYPYMLWGGILMVINFFFIWYVPDFFKAEQIIGKVTISAAAMLFWYLVIVNILLRTTYTIFIVPYTALGFEMCSDYAGRSKIQGIRSALNMAANLGGCAMAWGVFFGRNTETSRATNVAQNYVNMGTVFTLASFVFLFLMLAFTKKYTHDSRYDAACSGDVAAFFKDVKEVVLDRYSRWVFLFVILVQLGMVLVASMQMYVFEDFMVFSGWQKTIAHGATMVGMGIGSLFGMVLVKRFDKKGAILIGLCWSVFCEMVLALLFLTGFLKPDQMLGGFPISFALFSFFHGAYWFGNGLMMPVSISMMADISEIYQIQKGVNKDGSYAAMYSLAIKTSAAIGLFLSGCGLGWVGYVEGPDAVQTPEVIWRLCALTVVIGPLISLMAGGLIMMYPVNKAFIEKMRGELTA